MLWEKSLCYLATGYEQELTSLFLLLLTGSWEIKQADTVIVIDEIDYAFKHESVLGVIIDIVDETLCIVILVGMKNAKDRLAQINPHYFDRCNYFCVFKLASRKDIELLANQERGL